MTHRSRRAGFTLVEVLLASSLLTVIGLAIAETLRAVRDTDRRLQARSEQRAQEHALLGRIARDLRALLPPGGVYAAGLVGEKIDRTSGRDLLSSPAEEEAADARADQAFGPAPPHGSRDRVTLAILPGARRFGTDAPPGWGAIQSIVWEVDDDPATLERGLVRRPATVRDPVTGAPEELVEVVGPSVCGMALRYFDGTTWQDSWDSSAQDLIPQAIEVALAVRDPDGTLRRLATVVSPPAGRPSQLIEAKK